MSKPDKEENAVVIRESGAMVHPQWTDAEKALIRETVAPGLNDMEFRFFLYYAAALHLNPMAKEIYAIKYGSKLVPQVAIDGFLKHAQSTGKFRGFTEPEITIRESSGEVKFVPQKMYDPDNHKIVAATIGIRHADDQDPTFVTCTAKEYAVYFGDKLSDRWKKAPGSQLVKCCKALAIRTRFPGMGGAYLEEEMTSDDAQKKTITLEPTTGRQTWAPKAELPQETPADFGFGDLHEEPAKQEATVPTDNGTTTPTQEGELFNEPQAAPVDEVSAGDLSKLCNTLTAALNKRGVKAKDRQNVAIADMCKAAGAADLAGIRSLDQLNAAQDWIKGSFGE